jgi:hypothetical protein
MRKALLTGTAVLALGMFGFGISAANAQTQLQAQGQGQLGLQAQGQGQGQAQSQSSTNLNGNGNGNLNLNGNGNANLNANANFNRDSSSSTSFSGSASLAVAAALSNGVTDSISHAFAVDGSVISNQSHLENVANHTFVNVDLATASAGGHMGGEVTNNNQSPDLATGGVSIGGSNHLHDAHSGCFIGCDNGGDGGAAAGAYSLAKYVNNNGSHVYNHVDGSVGIVTSNLNGNGIAQFNTSVAIGAVNSGATLVSK